MHLINAKTHQLETFVGDILPRYAILSHTWGDEEVTMLELKTDPEVKQKAGYAKIRYTCDQALEDNLDYAWVDTCCIDKTSSAELSEAINSMFNYYARATICYAYLSDVKGPVEDQDAFFESTSPGSFRCSRWFSRGWTLQELIAPSDVQFYGDGWENIGHRRQFDLQQCLREITGIDNCFFNFTNVDQVQTFLSQTSIARRMSWAAKRWTTRKEDRAYCLLGIFGVNMPLLYGEEDAAFTRLQQEIIRSSTDHTIFTWQIDSPYSSDWDEFQRLKRLEGDWQFRELLAPSPDSFASSADVWGIRVGTPSEPFDLTNAGLRARLPVMQTDRQQYIGLLECHQNGQILGLSLSLPDIDQSQSLEFGKAKVFDINRNTPEGSRIIRVHPSEKAMAKKKEVLITMKSLRKSSLNWTFSRELDRVVVHLRDSTSALQTDASYPTEHWQFLVDESKGPFVEGLCARSKPRDPVAELRLPSNPLSTASISFRNRHNPKRVVICFRFIQWPTATCEFKVFHLNDPDLKDCCNFFKTRHVDWAKIQREYDEFGVRTETSLRLSTFRRVKFSIMTVRALPPCHFNLRVTVGKTPLEHVKMLFRRPNNLPRQYRTSKEDSI